MQNYNIKWNTQSENAGESMPLGGHDIGCNVWVEKNEILVYMAQSGAFDEEGRMDKAGRLRIQLNPNPFKDTFSQELKLQQGYIEIIGKSYNRTTTIQLWVDVNRPVIHMEIDSEEEHHIQCIYETWRGKNSIFTNKDIIETTKDQIVFYHRNTKTPVFDKAVKEQGIQSIVHEFPNVEKDRTFGGVLKAEGMVYSGITEGQYTDIPYIGYKLASRESVKKQNLQVYLHINQTETVEEWKEQLQDLVEESEKLKNQWEITKVWWEGLWSKSHVYIKPGEKDEEDIDWQVGRNYQLFRYMQACNAYGKYPTKFNGGLFTIDAKYWGTVFGSVYPDDRDWGGLIFTAQNQRLVYWPMIKNGDFGMMKPQFDFYKRILNGVKKRTEFFFGIEDAVCFPEQLDANGLSAFYGKYGLDYPLQVRYHYVEALEFGFMILHYAKASGNDISEYIDFIASMINFYDKTYQKLDEQGKRIIFPSTALETYHATENIDKWGREGAEAANYNEEEVAVTNPADLIAALHDVLTELLSTEYGTTHQRSTWRRLLKELPAIPIEVKKQHIVIAPCEWPKAYVKINSEFPQMNTVYPYNIYGINKPDLQLALDTYEYAWDEEDQLHHKSWHQAGIYAARIGLSETAHQYMRLKLGDSGRRFPAFWGPGWDYTPDHNWGGSGMIGVQEMLLQVFDGKIYLLPAWPKDLDVDFKLWADQNTYVEVQYIGGELKYTVTPEERKKDITIWIKK